MLACSFLHVNLICVLTKYIDLVQLIDGDKIMPYNLLAGGIPIGGCKLNADPGGC